MSPHARDRARQKRRNKKRQSVQTQRGLAARRNKQVLGIVLVMVVVIGGLVGLSLALNKKDKIVASGQATAQTTGQATSTPRLSLGVPPRRSFPATSEQAPCPTS